MTDITDDKKNLQINPEYLGNQTLLAKLRHMKGLPSNFIEEIVGQKMPSRNNRMICNLDVVETALGKILDAINNDSIGILTVITPEHRIFLNKAISELRKPHDDQIREIWDIMNGFNAAQERIRVLETELAAKMHQAKTHTASKSHTPTKNHQPTKKHPAKSKTNISKENKERLAAILTIAPIPRLGKFKIGDVVKRGNTFHCVIDNTLVNYKMFTYNLKTQQLIGPDEYHGQWMDTKSRGTTWQNLHSDNEVQLVGEEELNAKASPEYLTLVAAVRAHANWTV